MILETVNLRQEWSRLQNQRGIEEGEEGETANVSEDEISGGDELPVSAASSDLRAVISLPSVHRCFLLLQQFLNKNLRIIGKQLYCTMTELSEACLTICFRFASAISQSRIEELNEHQSVNETITRAMLICPEKKQRIKHCQTRTRRK